MTDITTLLSPAYCANNGPITSINLSSGGLAEIVRKASITSSGQITMTIPLNQVNDVLKSIIVLDKKGVVESLTLPGPEPLPEVFQNLPFSQADLQSPARLLTKLQGSRVRVAKAGKVLEGEVLGVTEKDKGEQGLVEMASILSEGRILSIVLDAGTDISFLDPDVQQKINRALTTIRRGTSDGARTLTLKVGGQGLRDILISYVVPAPIWKTAYRLITMDDNKARLQAWAIVDNASGEDWEEIQLTLTSGAPVTLKQRLHNLYWRERLEVPIDVSTGHVPRLDMGAAPLFSMAKKNQQMGAEEMKVPAQYYHRESPPLPVAPSQVGESEEGRVTATFSLPRRINLDSGETLSIPIVDQVISAQNASIYQPERESLHPVAAILVMNETQTSLPRGILTVYDQREGYVGDARISGMPTGERRIASFAVDKKVVINKKDDHKETISTIKVAKGVLSSTVKKTVTTTYIIKGAPDAKRVVVIEHPKRTGWTFSSDSHMESTTTHHRLKVLVAINATAQIIAHAERVITEERRLASTAEQQLIYWASQSPNADIAEKLRQLAKLKEEYTTLTHKIATIDQQRTREISDQKRFRANLAAVQPGTALYKRSIEQLSVSENQISSYDRERTELSTRQDKVSAIIDTNIMTF